MNQLSLNFNTEPNFSYMITQSVDNLKIDNIRIGIILSLDKKEVGEVYVSWKELLSSKTKYATKTKEAGKEYTIALYEKMILDLQEDINKLKNN